MKGIAANKSPMQRVRLDTLLMTQDQDNCFIAGYFRGNPHHFKEQHEQAKGHRFRSKLRWGDKHGGYGEHYWVKQ